MSIRAVSLSVTVAVGLTVASCASSSPTATVDTSRATSTTLVEPTESSSSAQPIGLIAIGHSGLTGEGTGGPREPENSWATGTSPEVNSVYLRLAAARPETLGHVANTAQGGAVADALTDQAQSALQIVPHPALVIVSTIDNDIRCDGSDAQHVPEFGAAVADALDVITSASPDSKILVVGQAGRPSPAFLEQLVAHDPSVKQTLTGSGICDFFDQNGNLVQQHFETLTAIINGYEAEETRVCGTVPQCSTDGGARAAYQDKLENFSSDWNHLNVRGQAAEASLIWPVVTSMLGL